MSLLRAGHSPAIFRIDSAYYQLDSSPDRVVVAGSIVMAGCARRDRPSVRPVESASHLANAGR